MEPNQIEYGAILATVVAGIISICGLIISKENKVSDFRQKWIEDLRSEVSLFIGYLELIFRYGQSLLSDKDRGKLNSDDVTSRELFAEMKHAIQEGDSVYYRIQLRLNRKKHKKIIDACLKTKLEIKENIRMSDEEFNKIKNNLVVITQDILKEEWERVKKGRTHI